LEKHLKSILSIRDKIEELGVDAIHPGYGFFERMLILKSRTK
jgi:acetyl/propionyl-CoA carboxylase alpha subunit